MSVVAARHHIGLYPFSQAVVASVADELDGYSFAKGTIRFSGEQPLSDDLVRRIVRLRRTEIDASLGAPAS
ncbi:MAG: hypothetical protein ACJ72E_08830 [Marmoricola sp.]